MEIFKLFKIRRKKDKTCKDRERKEPTHSFNSVFMLLYVAGMELPLKLLLSV